MRTALAVVAVVLLVTVVLAVRAAPSRQADAASAGDAQPASEYKESAMVKVRLIGPDGELTGPVQAPRLELSEEQWKQRLTPEQFKILRAKGTERPFCGMLLDNKEKGVYACAGCGLPLFETGAKFNSGTGWPSFFQPIASENILEEVDRSYGMVRTEIMCRRCEGHLGHVFNDGPPPTGLRYCLNSESLRFVKAQDLKQLAEPVPPQGDSDQPVATGDSPRRAEAVFAGGCFWCVEAVFEELDGVVSAVSGYAGGDEKTANYQAVSTGATKHAEAVKIIYDPDKVTYEQLLRVHFSTHDPTTLNRQGADVGPQYRSAIFYADEREKQLAQAFIDDLNSAKVFKSPIVTTLEPLEKFYEAEAYHQNYACQNLGNPYIRGVTLPKVEKVRSKFKDMLKDQSPIPAR